METTDLDDLEAPANVLLLHDAVREPDECADLCCPDRPTADLLISYAGSGQRPGTRGPGAGSARLGIVSVGDVLRSGSATAPDFGGPVAVDAVDDPADLSAIGLSISQFCEQWGGGPHQLVVCYRSLDDLLRHAPRKTAFQFVHVLGKRLTSVGALAHFHMDPSKHDEEVVAAFGSVFDAVVAADTISSVPEATDDEIAQLLDDWGSEKSVSPPSPSPVRAGSEATDEEVARSLPD